ncbi:MAG: TonB-dependent receptor [Deltaproteobacteria bacterium]|nr:TonB-dependent receptor [Deltaproteobacteria bacterium]
MCVAIPELLLGINAERASGDIENRITDERHNPEVLADISFYNQLTLKPIAPLTLVLGTRELYSNQYEWVFLYKAGARVTIVDGLFLRTRIARNFRQPTIRELYLPYPTANPDLKPEYSLVWDFGAGWISKYVEVSCSGYRTAADDLIKYFGVWPSAEVVNIDRVVIWGVEGEIILRMSELVSLRFTADFQDVGRYTRQNPDAKMNGTLDLGKKFGPHFVGGCLSVEWVHGLYMADYERQPLDDVLVFDLSLRYRYQEQDSKLMLEPYLFLRNIFDNQYAYIAGYTMPGFNLLLGLKVGV